METTKKNDKKKKGILASIFESMVKTGGCCGSGESCSCGLTPAKNKQNKDQSDDKNGSGKK